MKSLLRASAIVLTFAMIFPHIAFGDSYTVDNDTLSPGNQNNVSLTAAPGSKVTTSGQLVVSYQGNNHLAAGTTVTFAPVTSQTTLPLPYTAETAAALPSGWGSDIIAVTATSTVSFMAPSTPGTYGYTVKWDASGYTCVPVNSKCLTGSSALNISLTVFDATPPNISATCNGAACDTGWFTTDVHVEWTVTDPESAVTSTTDCASADLTGTTSGSGTPLTCTATSAGGTASTTVSVKLDETPPTIVAAATTSPNTSGWYKNDVIVQFTCADVGSGLATICPSDETLSASGTSTAETISDVAGNTATSATVAVRIDKTPPTITATRDSDANGAGWYNANVTVTFSCSDDLSGVADCSTPATLSAEGRNESASGTATDVAGNMASKTLSGINIDKTPPTITATADRSANAAGWYNADVTVTFACTDALSGISTCASSVPLTAESAGQSATGIATDVAGNSASTTLLGINIDKTAPTITMPASTTVLLNAPFAVSATAADALSDVASRSCLPAMPTSGMLDTSTPGPKTFICTAADRAGNTQSRTETYTVVYNKTCFLAPLKTDNTATVKFGSTVPLKCYVKDANGNTPTNVVITLAYALSSPTSGGTSDAVDTGSANGDTSTFRYTSDLPGYIFNWSTKGLQSGQTYKVTATFGDTTTATALITVK